MNFFAMDNFCRNKLFEGSWLVLDGDLFMAGILYLMGPPDAIQQEPAPPWIDLWRYDCVVMWRFAMLALKAKDSTSCLNTTSRHQPNNCPWIRGFGGFQLILNDGLLIVFESINNIRRYMCLIYF